MKDGDLDNKWIGQRTIRPDGAEKVTGAARFGADFAFPGMLWGKTLRSPHPHARIRGIDTSKAEALPGVRAVMTGADLPTFPLDTPVMVGPADMRWVSRNVMARDKALYAGHVVAAVAATSPAIAEAAAQLIEVDYEVLPYVIDVEDAMRDDAPILHDHLRTGGVEPKPETASNVANRVRFAVGDVEKGFAEADVVVERSFRTAPVHQGYIEPHACVVSLAKDGQATIWSSSQGHFMVRNATAKLTGMSVADIKAIPAEIGGGFGGKTIVYLEPLAMTLARKSGRPVKMQMTREEVFHATGPTSGSVSRVKIGATKDGRITAAEGVFKFQSGAFPGSPVGNACRYGFAPYVIPNADVVGYDVVCNRPKTNAYRAPGAPIGCFAVESVMDELAIELGMDPLALREANAPADGTKTIYGAAIGKTGYADAIAAARAHPNLAEKLGPNQGRGVAVGYWGNAGGISSATLHVNEDGTATVITGHPDIGGSRASMVNIAAEMLGIDYRKVRAQVGDTNAVGISATTGGSRVTYASGMAVHEATTKVIATLKQRAAAIWGIEPEAVEWSDGAARPTSPNAGEFAPLTLAELAAKAPSTGGPIVGQVSLNATGHAGAFAAHVCDVEVDPETGAVKILRYTATQDVGRAIHPAYVEGQIQGGVVQGIGWALNEAYIYDKNGKLDNPGFLDYRMPVASDLPMISTVMIECPNDAHPYGVRGVGEAPIVPPLAAVANAIRAATGKRLTTLPMSPPAVLQALGTA
mgnify:CR=1 FL=1